MQPDLFLKSSIGFLVALSIVTLWIGSLVLLLSTDISQLILLWILLAILGRTFLQTGLFIVAHDAIHGSVFPSVGEASSLKNRRLNHWVGQLAVSLYALLSYQKLSLNHWHHHRHPGQASDPDFHDGIHRHPVAWYLKFMQGYLDKRQQLVLFVGMGVLFFTLYLGFHVPILNLALFWLLPIVLSSMQLFFFGTYLPHQGSNDANSYRATSSNYPLVLSFLTCYHFGYHWEHHEYPALPWYRLPSVRQSEPQSLLHTADIGQPLIFRLATTSPLVTLLLITTC